MKTCPYRSLTASLSLAFGIAALTATANLFAAEPAAASNVAPASKSAVKDTYFVSDYLGTTLASTDAAGEIAQIETDAFGAPIQPGAMPQDMRYTGKPYDEDMGAYIFPFRNYRPDEARWMTPDPSGFPDGTNNFKYTGNPLRRFDPLGLRLNLTNYGEISSDTEYEMPLGTSCVDINLFAPTVATGGLPSTYLSLFSNTSEEIYFDASDSAIDVNYIVDDGSWKGSPGSLMDSGVGLVVTAEVDEGMLPAAPYGGTWGLIQVVDTNSPREMGDPTQFIDNAGSTSTYFVPANTMSSVYPVSIIDTPGRSFGRHPLPISWTAYDMIADRYIDNGVTSYIIYPTQVVTYGFTAE